MCFSARYKSGLIENATDRSVLGVTQADPELFTLPAAQRDSFHPSLPACGGHCLPCEVCQPRKLPEVWKQHLLAQLLIHEQCPGYCTCALRPACKKNHHWTPRGNLVASISHAGSSASLETTYKVHCWWREKAIEVLLELPICSIHYKYIRKSKLFTIS